MRYTEMFTVSYYSEVSLRYTADCNKCYLQQSRETIFIYQYKR